MRRGLTLKGAFARLGRESEFVEGGEAVIGKGLPMLPGNGVPLTPRRDGMRRAQTERLLNGGRTARVHDDLRV